jgi:GT2 family glycosyltransferase
VAEKDLHQLYAEHTGKSSDKWSLYLTEYDRLLDAYRDKPVRLLEIGVQNGGSLEIWSKYFGNASALIGCDINPDCGRLSYDDPRISIIVGDANAPDVFQAVLQRSPQFDVIIDDGSHASSDIIKSFALYFPRLAEGGIFIAEDLHCSYWQMYEGGLFDPYSSISFFKRLADVINHEHWGIARERVDILRGFLAKYGCEIDPESLLHVYSVEFINSICVIRKSAAAAAGLGRRVIAGSVELVVTGHSELHNTTYAVDPMHDQSNNPWTARTLPLDEMLHSAELAIAKAKQEVASLNAIVKERDAQITSLRQTVRTFQESTSWRITKPVRIVGRRIRQIKKLLVVIWVLLSNPKALYTTVIALRSKGLPAIRLHLRLLESEEYAAAVSKERGVPREFLKALVGLGALVRKLKRAWAAKKRPARRAGPLSYKAWARMEQKRLKAEIPDINRHLEVMLHKPAFTIVIDARRSFDGWKRTLKSLASQIYPHYELRVLANADVTLPPGLQPAAQPLRDMSLADVRGDFIVFVEAGQILSRNALYEFANAVNQHPDLDLIYGDQDQLNAAGERCDPFHKPDWSPDYLETFNYLAFPTCFRTAVARGCFDSVILYDLALRFTERSTKIWHVTKILGHTPKRTMDEDAQREAAAKDIVALQGRLSRTGRRGTVCEHELHRGCYEIRLDFERQPLVSVIIPTAGKTVTVGSRQIDLITNVIDQIRSKSTYKNVEIIVVDNGDLSPRQLQMLADQGCKRVTYTESEFNVPKKLRLGATIASGELFLLMNDDIEVVASDWIERMVEHFEKPHVGVVGAKLLYPDGRTQHVGVVHNSGNPDHVRRLFPRDDAGYYFSTCGVRNFLAVTGAVMMTSAKIYREVGGYSEELAVSYNDADYCLMVQEKGLRIVYAPRAELIHMESQSRIASVDMDEVGWYHNRWASRTASDPYYNEQFLTVASPTFVPCVNQRLL